LKKLYNENINNLYCYPNIIQVIKSRNEAGAACSTYGEKTGAYRILVGKTERKRSLGRPRRRWKDNIKLDLQKVECGVLD